mgnify:FL=1|jgi:hypothetical protein
MAIQQKIGQTKILQKIMTVLLILHFEDLHEEKIVKILLKMFLKWLFKKIGECSLINF